VVSQNRQALVNFCYRYGGLLLGQNGWPTDRRLAFNHGVLSKLKCLPILEKTDGDVFVALQ